MLGDTKPFMLKLSVGYASAMRGADGCANSTAAKSHQMKVSVPMEMRSKRPLPLRKGDSLSDSLSSHYLDSDRVET